ncbi:MAG: DUF4843 domain-containing protein [Sphingobacterium sp.]|jgi:hypothetical protein|nr:DUF4843 domain-containing protein [Sphingobacterium sp.]
MNNINKIIIAAVFLICITSCKQAELEYHSANNTILFEGIDQTGNKGYVPQDTNSFSFGYVSDNIKDSLYFLSVFTTGGPASIDRSYNIDFSKNSTLREGIDYELLTPQFVIRSGEVRDVLVFKLLRTPKMQTDTLFMDMKLLPNENFETEMVNQIVGTGKNKKKKNFTIHHFTVDDIAGAPWFWDPKKNPSATSLMGYLGDFSAKKFQIMASRFDWDIDVVTAEKYMPAANLLVAWSKSMQVYLNEMEAMGTPVYEVDGVTFMKMGKYAQ